MSTRTPDIEAIGDPVTGRPERAALLAAGRLPDRVVRAAGSAAGSGQLPVGIRIALALGLRPRSRPGRTVIRRSPFSDLDLVGGVARTLARRRTRNQPP